MLSVTILTSEAEVEAIAASWRKLQAAAGRIPFTDYYFYEAWWRHIGKPEGKTPFIVTGHIDHRLVALMALSVSTSRGLRILRGVGVDAYYLWDCLLESPAYAEPLWRAVRQSRLYDLGVIKYSDPDSAGGKALTAFARRCGKDSAPSLDVEWQDSDAWFSLKSSHTRGKNKRAMRRLQDTGVRHHVCTDGAAPLDIIDAMVRQRVDWSVKRKLKHGLFSMPGATGLFRQLVAEASARQQLYFSWFALDERVVACFLAFLYKETLFVKSISNDAEWSHESPGNLILIAAIRWAIDNRFRRIDFGIGVSEYKMRYARGIKEYDERVFGATPKGHMAKPLFITYRWFREFYMRQKESNPFIRRAYAAVEAVRRVKQGGAIAPASAPIFSRTRGVPHRSPRGH